MLLRVFRLRSNSCGGGPGDGGVDVILVQSSTPTLVQVKRRSKPEAIENVSTVRELLGTLLVQGKQSGIIVSTASRFSSQAVREAQVPVVRNMGYKLCLYNYDALFEVIRHTASNEQPWEGLWKSGEENAHLK